MNQASNQASELTLADRLTQALGLIESVRAGLSAPAIRLVEPGTNLQSLVGDVPAGETLVLTPGFVSSGLTCPKPVTLIGGTLVGVTTCGPGVTLRGVTLKGAHKDHTILMAGENTLVEDCQVIGSSEGQHRGIAVNARHVTIRRTSVKNIWHSLDAQAIAGWDGTKDLLVEDCPLLEASGENVILGGSDPASEDRIPQDVIIRRCHLSKPLAFRTLANCTNKNLFELKNCKRVLVEDVTMAYSWVDGQTGFAILVTVRNQGGAAPWSTIEDVTFRRVHVQHCAGGIQVLGRDSSNPSQVMKRVTFEDVIVEDISPEWGSNQRVVQLGNGGEGLTFRRCRFQGTGINSAMTFAAGSPTFSQLVVDGCEFHEGQYGIKGDNVAQLGTAALEAYASSYTWTNNTIRISTPRPRVIAYPSGTTIAV